MAERWREEEGERERERERERRRRERESLFPLFPFLESSLLHGAAQGVREKEEGERGKGTHFEVFAISTLLLLLFLQFERRRQLVSVPGCIATEKKKMQWERKVAGGNFFKEGRKEGARFLGTAFVYRVKLNSNIYFLFQEKNKLVSSNLFYGKESTNYVFRSEEG